MSAVQALYHYDANLDLPSVQKGWTPVHYAANGGHHKLVKKLYELGADTEKRDKAGFTACHLAAQCNQVGVLKTLFVCQKSLPLKNDCLMTRSNTGTTPLHVAAQFDCLEALKFLIRCGCDVEALDEFRETPGHKAARSGAYRCLKTLGDAGAGMNMENVECDTQADLAQLCGRHFAASKDELGPSKVKERQAVHREELRDGEHLFSTGCDASLKRRTLVGMNNKGMTPMQMRKLANERKGQVVEFRPPRPKGDPPKFQQRTGRLDFEYNR